MRSLSLGIVVGSLALFGWSPYAWAGHPQERQGFWIGFGGGYGSANVSCDGCEGGDREGAFAGFFKLGGTLNDQVLLRLRHHGVDSGGEGFHGLQAQAGSEARTSMKQIRFPEGWDEARVQSVLAHYDTQTEVEAVAEDEAAFEAADQALVGVPHELVPAVREMIAKHRR